MADGTKLFSLIEEGCFRLSPHIRQVVFHKSLNVLLGFTNDDQVSVIDIASGTVLHNTRLTVAAESNIKHDSHNSPSSNSKLLWDQVLPGDVIEIHLMNSGNLIKVTTLNSGKGLKMFHS